MTPSSSNHTRNGLIFVGVCAALALAIYLGFRLAPTGNEESNSAVTNDVNNQTAAHQSQSDSPFAPNSSEVTNSAIAGDVANDSIAYRPVDDSPCPGVWYYRDKQELLIIETTSGRAKFDQYLPTPNDAIHTSEEYQTPASIEGVLIWQEQPSGLRYELDCRASGSTADLSISSDDVNEDSEVGQTYKLVKYNGAAAQLRAKYPQLHP